MAIIAAAGAQPEHTDWYHNVVANPAVTVEVGADTIAATAREAHGPERDDLDAWRASELPALRGVR